MPLVPPIPKQDRMVPRSDHQEEQRVATELEAQPDEAQVVLPSWQKLAAIAPAVPVAAPLPAVDIVSKKGEDKPDPEAKSQQDAARASGKVEGRPGPKRSSELREEEAKAKQDAREGRVPTAEDSASEIPAEQRAALAEEEAQARPDPKLPALRRGRAPPVDAAVAVQLAAQSDGAPLSPAIIEAFAALWGEDFSNVIIHIDEASSRAADLLAAEAFTIGEHVYFAAGAFAPGSTNGAALLAHELAHVVQLRRGQLASVSGVPRASHPLECAADAFVARSGVPVVSDSAAAPCAERQTPAAAQVRGPVLRRTTDAAKDFFHQGYFQQAAGWADAGTTLDAELASDSAADTEMFPDPSASLGPEQPVAPPAVAEAPALALEGEIEAEATTAGAETILETDEDLGDAPPLPALGSLSVGADGDTSAARARLDGALEDVPTEFDVTTSAGPAPDIELEGAADPAQTVDQEATASEQAAELQAQAAAAVEQGPGPEQVQPDSYHETLEVPAQEPGTLEPLGEIPEMVKLQADPVPEDVRAATDAAGQEQLTASMAEADAAMDTAAADHETRRTEEVTSAESEQERLNQEANAAQDAEVRSARGEIDGHRTDALAEQELAVADLDTQAADERARVEGDIETRVADEERAIDDEFAQAERDAEAEKAAKEAEARAEKEEAERQSEDQSWWESALDAIASFFDALLDAVNAIFDALVEAIGDIIEAAKAAVVAIIDAVRDFAISLVQAFGEFLKGLVNALLADIFPELARALNELIDAGVSAAVSAINYIADQLKAGILALLDAIGAAITALLEAWRAALNAALQIAKAALTGDWAALARMVLEAALELAGIPPETFYEVASSALDALDTIISDPGAFVSNVISAVATGFQNFADNILTHSQEGFFAWIVGPLGELGLTLPATWDFAGIFGLVMQVLGLTREGIRQVITEELGETAGLIFDFVWRYVGALIEGGLEGLWNEVQNDLGMLWDMVVEGIKSWLIETIVTQAVIRIATMFNPVGALINALITVWNVLMWLRDNVQRIFGVIQAIVTMLASIAAGNIEPAAQAVERALASLIPIAISLLANLLGLGGITARVRELIESAREAVRNAIRSLIRRVRSLFSGGDGTEAEEEETEPDADGTVTLASVSFSAETGEAGRSEGHRVFAERAGERPQVMVASGDGVPVEQQLAEGGEFAALEPSDAARVRSLTDDAERLYIAGEAAETPEAAAESDADADAKIADAAPVLATVEGATLLTHLRDEENTAHTIDGTLEQKLGAAAPPPSATRLPATLTNVYSAWDKVAVLFDRTTNIGQALAASVQDVEVIVTKDGEQVTKSLSDDVYVRALRAAVASDLDGSVRQPTMLQAVLATPAPSVPAAARTAIEEWLESAEPLGRAARTEAQLLAQIEQYRQILRGAGAEASIADLDQDVDTPVTEATVTRYRNDMKPLVVAALPGLADFSAFLERADLFGGNPALKGELFRQWAQTYLPGISEGTPLLNVNDNGRVRAMADAFVSSGVQNEGSVLVDFKSHGPTSSPSPHETAQMDLYGQNLPGTWLVNGASVVFTTIRYIFAHEATAALWYGAIVSRIAAAQVYVGAAPYAPAPATPPPAPSVEEE